MKLIIYKGFKNEIYGTRIRNFIIILAQGLFLRQFILQDIFNCLKLFNIFLIMSNAPAMQEKLRVISHRACI